MLVVLTILGILATGLIMGLPGLKGAGDVTKAAYDIEGALENARTYALANDTYVWVGIFEENGAVLSTTPATKGTGRIVISTVASGDGTSQTAPAAFSTPSTSLIQTIKLLKINNMHLATTYAAGSGTGATFALRPAANSTISPPSSGTTFFPYPLTGSQYGFIEAIEFNPRGEVRVLNNLAYASTSPQQVVEMVLQPTHGTALLTSNVAAVQITGIAGNVKTYRQ